MSDNSIDEFLNAMDSENYKKYKDDLADRIFTSAKCLYDAHEDVITYSKSVLKDYNDRLIKLNNRITVKYSVFFLFSLFIITIFMLYFAGEAIYCNIHNISEFSVWDARWRVSMVIELIFAEINIDGWFSASKIPEIEKDIKKLEKEIVEARNAQKDIIDSNFKEIKCPKCGNPMKVNIKDIGKCNFCGFAKPRYRNL